MGKFLQIRIRWIGLGHQIKQIERASGCHRKIGRDGGDDASRCARDDENCFVVQLQPRSFVFGGLLFKTDCPTQGIFVTDFHRAGITQGLFDQLGGNVFRFSSCFEINRFDQGLRPLAFERLSETADRTAERCEGSLR
ncbi:MAG TPA: hypothetical protein VGQ40_06855, partial [Chthoniobacterales bacterium]|nr:hypothetical protein [Chthoniobacterales bacterium]